MTLGMLRDISGDVSNPLQQPVSTTSKACLPLIILELRLPVSFANMVLTMQKDENIHVAYPSTGSGRSVQMIRHNMEGSSGS